MGDKTMRIEVAFDKSVYLNSNRNKPEAQFHKVLEKETKKARNFIPSTLEEVSDAWDAALKETGINPCPMNKISTALVAHVESGRREPFSLFLGNDKNEAILRTKEIIERLENPIVTPYDIKFTNDELNFYRCLLNKLMI